MYLSQNNDFLCLNPSSFEYFLGNRKILNIAISKLFSFFLERGEFAIIIALPVLSELDLQGPSLIAQSVALRTGGRWFDPRLG